MEVSTTTRTSNSKSFILYSYFKAVRKNPVLEMLRPCCTTLTRRDNREIL